MATYKVSYVLKSSNHPGGIITLPKRPEVGSYIKIGDSNLEVVEVVDLMPPRGNFHYIHATCKANPVNKKAEG